MMHAGRVTAAALAVHILPAGTWLPPVRRTFFPGLHGVGDPGHVALTFDDGPDPVATPQFLEVLGELDVRGTFFLLGEQVRDNPGITSVVAENGHELAVHGWKHHRPLMPGDPPDWTGIARTKREIQSVTGLTPVWYRPAYGILTAGRWAAARRSGLRTVLWSAWGKDWTSYATASSVRAEVGRDLRGGATILLHDSDSHSAPGCWRAALEALPRIVSAARDMGLRIGPLAEHGVARR